MPSKKQFKELPSERLVDLNHQLQIDDQESLHNPHIKKIRPKYFKEYIGQKSVCDQLQLSIQATRSRGEPLDHVLFFGPPGLGKTTLAQVVATEMAVGLKQTSGPILEKTGDLAAILTTLEPYDLLFIDEIHRLNRSVEEMLYSAMEDFQLDILVGEGPAARSIRLDLPPFTLVGATTRAGLLTAPLRDRFGMMHHLVFYTFDELTLIIKRSAEVLKTIITETAAYEIAKRARGTPRIANRLLKRVREYAIVQNQNQISIELAQQALNILNIDELGLDPLDHHYLLLLIDRFKGGPVGIESLAAALHEERDTLEDVLEPFLIQAGFIFRTPRGRVATQKAVDHVKIRK